MSDRSAMWWRAAVVLASAAAFIRCLIEAAIVTEWGYVIGETRDFDGLELLLVGWGGVLGGWFHPLLFASIIAAWVCACAERRVAAVIWAIAGIGVPAILSIFLRVTPNNAGYVAWLANPIIVATWFLYLDGKRPAALISAVLALGLTLAFLSVAEVPLSEKLTPVEIISYGAGYWLWIASAAILVAGVSADAFLYGYFASDHR
jgi:hypothetical protein